MMDLAKLGIQVDSAGAVKGASDLDRLTAAGARAEKGVTRVGTASVAASKGMGAAAGNSRMMAMQLSQVAQQTSATGNFVQALAIQLPDMALGFGAAGIAAGVLAGVALPLLASAFGSTSTSARDTEVAMEGLDAKTKAFTAAAAAAQVPTAELAATYGSLAVEARAAFQAMSDVALVDAINATNAAVQAVTGSLIQLQVINKAGGTGTFLVDTFGLAADEATRLRDAIVALDNAKGLAAQAKAAAEVQRQLLAAFGSIDKMPPALQAAAGQMATIVLKAGETNATVAKLPSLLNLGASAASAAASAVGGISGAAQNAYGSVSALVGKMYELAAAQAATEASQMNAAGVNYGKVVNSGGVDAIARAGNVANGATARSIAATEAAAALAASRAAEITGASGHAAALEEIETDHQATMAEIKATAAAAQLGGAETLFGTLASVAEIGGKKTAKAAAALAAVQTTVSGYAAAMSAAALAPTLLGKVAVYAGWLATSAKAVSAINAAGGGSGRGRGIGGGSSPAAQAAAPASGPQSRLIVQGIKLTDLITGEMLMNILGKEFGARNVEFVR
jgi:hypothetical protein